jgi:hypothetical protein
MSDKILPKSHQTKSKSVIKKGISHSQTASKQPLHLPKLPKSGGPSDIKKHFFEFTENLNQLLSHNTSTIPSNLVDNVSSKFHDLFDMLEVMSNELNGVSMHNPGNKIYLLMVIYIEI